MSQESLIWLSKPASQDKTSRIQFITRTSFENIFPNKEVPICLPDSESFCLSLSPQRSKKNKDIHQKRKPILYKEDFQGQEEDDEEEECSYESYESYGPDDPDFEVNELEVSDEDDPNYEASEDESPANSYSEENILEEVDDEREVQMKTEERESECVEIKELEHQEKLFIDRKNGKMLLNLPELNRGKRYRLYQDWKILKAVDFYVAKHGDLILKNEDFWENLKDPMTGSQLLRNSRYSKSIFERYTRRLRYISEDAKERIYKLVEGLTKQEMLDCYCKFSTPDDCQVCFLGVQKVGEKVKYLLKEEAPQKKTNPRKSMKQMKNSLVIPNHGYGTRAAKSKRNVCLRYETDSSFTAGSVDVSAETPNEGEEDLVSDYSGESSEPELMSENVLNLAAASQPVCRAEESDFLRSPSVPKGNVRYGTSQPVTEEQEYSRDLTSRKRLVRMRESTSSFASLEIMNTKRKAIVDLDKDFPLQKKIHTVRKPRIDEEEENLQDKDLNVLMLFVDSDSDKKKDSKLLKVSQNYPSHFLNSLLEFQGEVNNREDFENHLESQGYQVFRSQESQLS